jgi:hypothetical protein
LVPDHCPSETADRKTGTSLLRRRVKSWNRIRGDVGSALRTEYAAEEPAPKSFVALLKELETRIRDAELERGLGAVEERIAELLRAAGRAARNATRKADEPVPL